MKRFVEKHEDRLLGVLECYDRIVFKGHPPFPEGGAVERLFGSPGLPHSHFKKFVSAQSERTKAHAKALAARSEGPIIYLQGSRSKKEKEARKIARRDGVESGLVRVFSAPAACSSFALRPGKRGQRIVRKRRKCIHVYFYFLDRGHRPGSAPGRQHAPSPRRTLASGQDPRSHRGPSSEFAPHASAAAPARARPDRRYPPESPLPRHAPGDPTRVRRALAASSRHPQTLGPLRGLSEKTYAKNARVAR